MAEIKNMTTGSPARLFLAFSLPLMVGNVFQQLYTVVDTMVVGRGAGNVGAGGCGDSGLVQLDCFWASLPA